jgi:hypothetical protein
MSRIALILVLAALTLPGSARAQIPAGPGQQPGTLPPAPPVIPPPPMTVPRPVPSAVTPPLAMPSYGVPPGVTRAPSYGSGTLSYTIRSAAPKKRKKKPRTYGTSVR